jgi:hypothetical protein
MSDRDQEIAAMIRREIAKVEADKERLGYRLGSAEDGCLQGQVMGLRRALAFVDPNPLS